MDKILMSNLGFYGYHGLLKEEAVLGQKFFIDIELYLDTKEAGETDDMYKSVSYADVYEVVKEIVENKRFNLLEALAENIASEVLEKFDLLKGIMVRVKKACDLLDQNENVLSLKKSNLYETKAWGYTDQADFLNMCVEIETSLAPYDLLSICQDIENKLNRVRVIRWGPRTIDVDVLFYDDIVSDDEKLLIPHPRIKERAFVLVPLMDLNKELSIDGKTIGAYLNDLSQEERDEVKKFRL